VARFLNAAKLKDNMMYCDREFQRTGVLQKHNCALANVCRGEDENYGHDAMGRRRFLLGSVVK